MHAPPTSGTGDTRHLSLPFDARLRAHAGRVAERLLEADSRLLVPVREIRATSDGLDLVFEREDDARPLSDLLRTVDLAPGQVVALGLALAEALAALHDVGLTHGRLRAEDVLLRRGELLLTGYGVAAVQGSAGRPVDDLRALLELLEENGQVGAGWLATIRAAVEAGEHDARSVRSLLSAIGPRPQSLPGAAPAGLPVPRPAAGARHRARRRERRLLGALPSRGLRTLGLLLPAVLGTLLLAGWVGATASPEAEPDPPAPAAERPQGRTAEPPPGETAERARPSPPDWRAVLTQLDVTRAGILAAPDEGRLAEVDAVGSSAYADDLAAVRALKGRRAVARGVRFDLQTVRVRSAGEWRADLEVTDALRPHTIVSTAGGAVLEERPARPSRASVVTLVRTDAGWRIAQVVPR